MSENSQSRSAKKINEKRIFVLDTNVLLHDSTCLNAFYGSVVVIPLVVLEELDQFKSEKSELGLNARHVSRKLDELRLKGSLEKGVLLQNGVESVLVKVLATFPEIFEKGTDLPLDVVDNKIIMMAKYLSDDGNKVTFVSKDINVRIKASAIGLSVDDYKKGVVSEENYSKGCIDLILTPDEIKKITVENLEKHLVGRAVLINQYVIATNEPNSAKYRLFRKMMNGSFKEVGRSAYLWSFRDKNVEQHMALDLLMDDTIHLVFLLGPAGTGKTFLALLVGLYKILEEKNYNKLLAARPLVSLGADLGFLPGDIHEKLYQWMHPVYDNLEYIFDQMQIKRELPKELQFEKTEPKKRKYSKHGKHDDELNSMHGAVVHKAVEHLIREGMLSLEAITYMRGRSIPNQFMFVDEVQNLTPHEVKTIISRAGEGTKVIMAGDPYQIDSPYLDFSSNGLTVTSEKLKGLPLVGSVFLSHSERSALAKLAVEKL